MVFLIANLLLLVTHSVDVLRMYYYSKTIAPSNAYESRSTLAAHTTPAPFSGLVLIDPVISPSSFSRDENIRQLVVGALARRSVWSSR